MRDGALDRRSTGAVIAGGREGLFQRRKRTGVHRIDQLVEVGDRIVNSSDGAADFRRQIACPQGPQALRFKRSFGRIDQGVAQFVPSLSRFALVNH